MNMPFKEADILLPKKADMHKWSVVACDQYTSEPKYWEEVSKIVGKEPSTLNLVLPEVYLEDENVSERIKKINKNMEELMENNFFQEYEKSLIYIEELAFAGCKNLRKVVIPETVQAIDKLAFKGSKNVVIYGKKESYVASFAKENNITFKEIK